MIKHECEECNKEPEKCYCEKCLEWIKQDFFDRGYDARKMEEN